MNKLILIASLISACAVQPTECVETTELRVFDTCDPYFQPACGLYEGIGGGVIDLGGAVFNYMVDVGGGGVTFSACFGTYCRAVDSSGETYQCWVASDTTSSLTYQCTRW